MFPSSERLSPKTITWVNAGAAALTRIGVARKMAALKSFLMPMIFPLLKNETDMPFGCNACISPVIRDIAASADGATEAECLAFQSPQEIGKGGALAHGSVQPLQIFVGRFRQRDSLGASGARQHNLIPLNRFNLIGETRNRASSEEGARRFRRRKNSAANLIFAHHPPHRTLAQDLII